MTNLVTVEANRLLDDSLPDDTVYVALTSDAPTASAAGTELSGNGYARQAISMAAAAAGAKTNDTQILFPAATGSAWAEIQGYDIYTASTGGTRRWFKALDAGDFRTVNVGDQYRIAVGDLDFSMS